MSSSRQGEVPHEFIKGVLDLSDEAFEHIQRNPELLEKLGGAALELISKTKLLEVEKARRRGYQAKLATTEEHLVSAETDEVTGLLTRKAFLRTVRELDLTDSRHLAVMMDIRGLKAVNDQIGHQAGDFVLAGTARTLVQKGVRSGSVLGRYGGDEIIMVIPIDEETDGGVILERLQELFDGSETAELCDIGDGQAIHLSARFGCSEIEGVTAEAIDEAIHQADLMAVQAGQAEKTRGIMPPIVRI